MARALRFGLVGAVILAAAVSAEARTLHGVVFADLDSNGQQGTNEPGVGSAVVAYDASTFVVADATGQFDLPVPDGAAGNAWVRVPAGYAPGPVWQTVQGATSLALGVRPVPAPALPLRIVVASDSHMGPSNNWYGDLGAAAANATRLDPPPAFFMLTGDVTQGDSDDEFDTVASQLASLTVPFVPVPGNHDWYDSGATWRRRIGPDNYSFDVANVHFVIWNMADSDSAIAAYLGAELAHVDPSMTIVALSHAPPQPATVATLRSLGVDYVLTGHTHTNRAVDHGGMLELNFEPFLMGGLDFTPAGYRVVTFDHGTLSAYHRTVIDQPVLAVMSPTAGQCVAAAGDTALAAAEIDASALAVSGRIDGGDPITATARGGWIFAVATPPLAPGPHTLVVTAQSASGNVTTATVAFDVCSVDTPTFPATPWAQVNGGPDHTNAVAGELVPPLVPRWTTALGGHVLQGAPVFASGLVIETAVDLGDDTTGAIVAVDVATGAVVWRVPLHARGGPAIAGKVVVVAAIDGTVFGLDLDTGAQLWSVPLGDGIRAEAQHIMAAPTIADGVAYIGNEQDFEALDVTDGTPLWMADPLSLMPAAYRDGGDYDFASIGAVGVSGGYVVGSFSRNSGLFAWNSATGSAAWGVFTNAGVTGDLSYTTVGVNGSPVIVGDTIYVVDSSDAVSAFALADGTLRWTRKLDANGGEWGMVIASAPAISGHVIVVPTLYGKLVAVDTADGHTLWSHDAAAETPLRTTHYRGAHESGYEASPVIDNGVVWAVDTSGVLVALDLETGHETWKAELGAPALASPAISDGWLFVATFDGTLHAWSLPYGAPVADPLETDSGGCCDTGGRGGRGGVLLAALVGLVLRRRRRA